MRKNSMTRHSLPSLAVVVLTLSLAMPAAADYAQPWLPEWSGETGYTSQFWGLHADGEAEPAQPLAPDNYSDNSYGTAEATWDTSPPIGDMSYVQWLALPTTAGPQPAWVEGVYGGMVAAADGGPYALTLSLPAVTDEGALLVFVQYDWYEGGGKGASIVTPSIVGATDVTPAGYYAEVLGHGGVDNDRVWYRSTHVFAFAGNPGAFDVDLTIDGVAPMIDSVSVTTALDATVPPVMPIPEPATLAVLGVGALTIMRRRRVSTPRT
jgi:hypothetical protein